jgi:hypothetical protein
VIVMRGLDPRIHHNKKEAHPFDEEDGLPGQARQ